MEILSDGLQNLFFCLSDWFLLILRMAFDLAAGALTVLFFWILVCVFSGAAAAERAERGGHSPVIHFAAGFLFPVVYPWILRLFIKPVEAWTPDSSSENFMEGQRIYVSEAAPDSPKPAAPEVSVPENGWSQNRVEQIRYAPDGSEAGPFLCRLSDGREYKVRRIVAALADVASFEIEPKPGSSPVTVRFPYGRIVSLEQTASLARPDRQNSL